MTSLLIGVDIGATKIASGLLDQNGNLLKTEVVPTLAHEDREAVLNQVYKSIEILNPDFEQIKGIGVCAPGPLKDGVIINPPNIPHWQNLSLANIIAERYSLPVHLENDANAAGFAEMIFGAAKGYKNFVYVTISTGIGTGIIIEGKIYRGKNSMAGEGGHVTINHNEAVGCSCGVPGCIEGLASGTAIAKRAQHRMKNNPKVQTVLWDYSGGELSKISTHEINKAIKADDKFAEELIEDAANQIGIWLGSVVSLLDPEAIIVGGGVAQIGDILFNKIKSTMPRYTINAFADQTPIIPAALKKDVGIYGAASLLFQ